MYSDQYDDDGDPYSGPPITVHQPHLNPSGYSSVTIPVSPTDVIIRANALRSFGKAMIHVAQSETQILTFNLLITSESAEDTERWGVESRRRIIGSAVDKGVTLLALGPLEILGHHDRQVDTFVVRPGFKHVRRQALVVPIMSGWKPGDR